MTWQINIPYQHRDEPLSATAGFARHLPTDDDRDVARQIVFGAMGRGVRTAGDLLDELQVLEPSRRREILDHARVEVGLPSLDTVERARAPLTVGPAPMTPTTEIHAREGGGFVEVPITEPRIVRTPSGGITDASVLEAAAARQRELEESDRRQRQARAADANAGAEQMRGAEAARRDQLRTELPDHLKETAS